MLPCRLMWCGTLECTGIINQCHECNPVLSANAVTREEYLCFGAAIPPCMIDHHEHVAFRVWMGVSGAFGPSGHLRMWAIHSGKQPCRRAEREFLLARVGHMP